MQCKPFAILTQGARKKNIQWKKVIELENNQNEKFDRCESKRLRHNDKDCRWSSYSDMNLEILLFQIKWHGAFENGFLLIFPI